MVEEAVRYTQRGTSLGDALQEITGDESAAKCWWPRRARSRCVWGSGVSRLQAAVLVLCPRGRR